MNQAINRYPIEHVEWPALQAEFGAATEWLNSHVVTHNTRLFRYRRILDEIVQAIDRNTLLSYLRSKNLRKVISALHEIDYFVFLHKGLAAYSGAGLTNRLKVVVGGPDSYTEEKPNGASGHGRDIALELWNAARLARSAVQVDLESITDVRFFGGGKEFYLECKRPKSLKKMADAIHKAESQLKTRYEGSNGSCHGLIAIGVEKLVNPELGMLITREESEIPQNVKRAVFKELSPVRDVIDEVFERDPRFLGYFFNFVGPMALMSQSLYLNSGKTMFLGRQDANGSLSPDAQDLVGLVE